MSRSTHGRTVVVTGAAGFIGGRIADTLGAEGWTVVKVDLPGRAESTHLELLELLDAGAFSPETAVVHQGAISSTLHGDEGELWELNFDYSKALYARCLSQKLRFIYASSAAVYGASREFDEWGGNEAPLNAYGATKWEFDRIVRERDCALATGLRYFNVYGPGEHHKGKMASIALQAYLAFGAKGSFSLFEGADGIEDGGHRRDFVAVEDVVAVVRHFLEHPVEGIFNVGTGEAKTFNELVQRVAQELGFGSIEYRPMPRAIAQAYQTHTCASLHRLRAAGYVGRFTQLDEGVAKYVRWLNARGGGGG